MNKLNIAITEEGVGPITYTNVSFNAGETKADVMARTIDDHRFIWDIDPEVTLEATARVVR